MIIINYQTAIQSYQMNYYILIVFIYMKSNLMGFLNNIFHIYLYINALFQNIMININYNNFVKYFLTGIFNYQIGNIEYLTCYSDLKRA